MIMVNKDTMKADYVCDECLSENEFPDLSLEETEDLLAQYESIAVQMEELIPHMRETEKNIPPELAAFAMTPTKGYKMALDAVRKLKMRRMELICDTPQADFLEKELKKAIEEEDFEKADILNKQLEELKDKDKKKDKKQQESTKEEEINNYISKLSKKLQQGDDLTRIPLIEETGILFEKIERFIVSETPDLTTIKKVIENLDGYDIPEIEAAKTQLAAAKEASDNEQIRHLQTKIEVFETIKFSAITAAIKKATRKSIDRYDKTDKKNLEELLEKRQQKITDKLVPLKDLMLDDLKRKK